MRRVITALDALVAATPGELDDVAWLGVKLAALPAIIAARAVGYLVTMRAAFPWWLRVLLIIGAIQCPVLPFDEVAAIIAAAVLLIRYRPALRVAWRAAQSETI